MQFDLTESGIQAIRSRFGERLKHEAEVLTESEQHIIEQGSSCVSFRDHWFGATSRFLIPNPISRARANKDVKMMLTEGT